MSSVWGFSCSSSPPYGTIVEMITIPTSELLKTPENIQIFLYLCHCSYLLFSADLSVLSLLLLLFVSDQLISCCHGNSSEQVGKQNYFLELFKTPDWLHKVLKLQTPVFGTSFNVFY